MERPHFLVAAKLSRCSRDPGFTAGAIHLLFQVRHPGQKFTFILAAFVVGGAFLLAISLHTADSAAVRTSSATEKAKLAARFAARHSQSTSARCGKDFAGNKIINVVQDHAPVGAAAHFVARFKSAVETDRVFIGLSRRQADKERRDDEETLDQNGGSELHVVCKSESKS